MSILVLSRVLYGAASDERKPTTTDDFIVHMCKKGIFETVPFGYTLPGALSSSYSSFSDSISGDELDSLSSDDFDRQENAVSMLMEACGHFAAYSTKSLGCHKDFVEQVVGSLYTGLIDGATFSDLVESGFDFDVNMPDCRGYRLLHFAAMQNNRYLVQVLLAQGADARAKNNSGDTALHCMTIVKTLRRRPLSDYVEKGDDSVFILDALLANMALLDIQNNVGRTPLHAAALHDNVDMLSMLVDKGACVDVEDHLKQTPLFIAYKRRNIKNSAILIKKGARQDHRDKFGKKPIDMIQDPFAKIQFECRLKKALKE